MVESSRKWTRCYGAVDPSTAPDSVQEVFSKDMAVPLKAEVRDGWGRKE